MVFLDALRIKVRDGGRVVNKSAYMGLPPGKWIRRGPGPLSVYFSGSGPAADLGIFFT